MTLSDYYIKSYVNNTDKEFQKNERKKIRNIIEKFKKNPNIFGCLSFDYLSIEEQSKIIHFFLEECNQRQIIDNLSKTNADADYSFLNIDNQNKSNKIFKYEPLHIDNFILEIREIIRNNPPNLLELLLNFNDQLFQAYLNEYEKYIKDDVELYCIQYVTDYIDYILNDVLQYLVYPIMMLSKDIDPIQVIKKLSFKIDYLSRVFDTSTEQRYKSIFGIDGLKADRVIHYFRVFTEHRNRLFENSNIYKILTNEMKDYPNLFCNVPYAYRAEKILLSEDQIHSDTLKAIVTENTPIPNFDKKLAITRSFINIMRAYGKRDCFDSCLQDIKVYFREIYMSKQKYHRQKSSKIVEDYLERVKLFQEMKTPGLPDFQKESQYIFIREKISRGYFREKNLSDAYVEKIEMTEKLNMLLLKCYWLADSKSALGLLHEYNMDLLLCYVEFLK